MQKIGLVKFDSIKDNIEVCSPKIKFFKLMNFNLEHL